MKKKQNKRELCARERKKRQKIRKLTERYDIQKNCHKTNFEFLLWASRQQTHMHKYKERRGKNTCQYAFMLEALYSLDDDATQHMREYFLFLFSRTIFDLKPLHCINSFLFSSFCCCCSRRCRHRLQISRIFMLSLLLLLLFVAIRNWIRLWLLLLSMLVLWCWRLL